MVIMSMWIGPVLHASLVKCQKMICSRWENNFYISCHSLCFMDEVVVGNWYTFQEFFGNEELRRIDAIRRSHEERIAGLSKRVMVSPEISARYQIRGASIYLDLDRESINLNNMYETTEQVPIDYLGGQPERSDVRQGPGLRNFGFTAKFGQLYLWVRPVTKDMVVDVTVPEVTEDGVFLYNAWVQDKKEKYFSYGGVCLEGSLAGFYRWRMDLIGHRRELYLSLDGENIAGLKLCFTRLAQREP